MAKSTKTLTEQLTEARAKVAEIEANIRKQAVGNFARVINEGRYECLEIGTIVKITRDVEDEYSLRGELLDESDYDDYRIDDLEILTYERARELLIAEVDRKLAEVYPVEAKGASQQ